MSKTQERPKPRNLKPALLTIICALLIILAVVLIGKLASNGEEPITPPPSVPTPNQQENLQANFEYMNIVNQVPVYILWASFFGVTFMLAPRRYRFVTFFYYLIALIVVIFSKDSNILGNFLFLSIPLIAAALFRITEVFL